MSHRPGSALGVVALLLALAAPSAAGPRLADLHGHLAIGYAQVFSSDTSRAPAGSLSVGTGLDYPIGAGLRAGLDVGYHLLGSRTLEEGTLSTGLDYSMLEALALLHWTPEGRGPQLVLSGGPGAFAARATLASSPVGAIFSRQAIDQWRAGMALAFTMTRRREAPVRAGLEVGVRVVPLESTTWTLVTARIAILY